MSSSSRNKYFLGGDLQEPCAVLVTTHSNYSKHSTEEKKQQLERVGRNINNNYSYNSSNSNSSNHHRGRSAFKPIDSTSARTSSTTRTATTATSAGSTSVRSSQGSSISASVSASVPVDAHDLYEYEHQSSSQNSLSDCDHDVHDHHQQQQDPKSISALESLVRQPKPAQTTEMKKKRTPAYANIEVVLEDHDDYKKEEKTAAPDAVDSNITTFPRRRSFRPKGKKEKSAISTDNQQQRHTPSLTDVTTTSSKSGSTSSRTIARFRMLNCFAAAGGRQQHRQDEYGYQDFNCSDSDAYGEGNSLAASNSITVSSADSSGRRTTSTSRRGRTTGNNYLLANPLKEEDETEEIDTNDESTTSTAYHEEFLKLSVTDIEEELERRDTLVNLPELQPPLPKQEEEEEYCHSQHQNQSVSSPPPSTREEKSSASPSEHDLLLTTHVEIPSKEESPIDKQQQRRYKIAAPSFLRRKQKQPKSPFSSSVISSLTEDAYPKKEHQKEEPWIDPQQQQQQQKEKSAVVLSTHGGNVRWEIPFTSSVSAINPGSHHSNAADINISATSISATSLSTANTPLSATGPAVIISGSNNEGFEQRISATTSVVQGVTTPERPFTTVTKVKRSSSTQIPRHRPAPADYSIATPTSYSNNGSSYYNAIGRRRKDGDEDDYYSLGFNSVQTGNSATTGNNNSISNSSSTTASVVNVAEMVARSRSLRQKQQHAEATRIVPRCHFCGMDHWIYNCPHMNLIDEQYWCTNLIGDTDADTDDYTTGTGTVTAVNDDDTTQMLTRNSNLRCNTGGVLNCFKNE